MAPNEELVLIFGALHLVALVLGALLFVMFLRGETTDILPPPDEDEGGGGGNDRISPSPQTSPSGGIPLLDAEPASTRLRAHGDSLRDARRGRRVAHQPGRRRTPARR